MTLKTPDEWAEMKGIYILDADGWRDDNAPDWDEPISEAEFDTRVSICTIGPRGWGQS